jgi:hypothetical protein
MASRPHLFSNVPVFLAASALDEMHAIVTAVEATAKLQGYRETVLAWAPEIAQRNFGPIGAMMGYDFHLDDDGPKRIEVNTNAGGAFLNAVLAKAQKACCSEADRTAVGTKYDDSKAAWLRCSKTNGASSGKPVRHDGSQSLMISRRSSTCIRNSFLLVMFC